MQFKRIWLVLATLVGALSCRLAIAGTIAPYDLQNLTQDSSVVVIGHVTRVKQNNEHDHVTVKVIDTLKGSLQIDEFRLTLTPRGLVGFDIALKQGEIGVFFLSAVPTDDDSTATLAAPHGVAILERGAFKIEE
ncbi:MAG: hypothetical protein AAFN07_16250 [Pseudomonadota bacterium]